MSVDRLDVVDEVPVDPATARIYAEGWQSWSPATWYPAGATGQRPFEEWQHTMRFRPGTPIAPEGLQGEGLLAIDPGDGSDVRCYATTSPVEIPSITATLVDRRVIVRSTTAVASSEAADAETALAANADAFTRRVGSTPLLAISGAFQP